MNISTFWPLTPKPGNFGDVAGPFLLRRLGLNPVHVSKRASGKLLTCGSIARFAKEGDTIWGSGIIRSSDHIHPGAKALCVRGPYTGARCGCEVYGDPGLLLPLFVDKMHPTDEDYTVFPHYVHIPLMRSEPQWIFPLTPSVVHTAKRISSANLIVSSSLHGIIVAHAYGIPAGWWRPDDKLSGDDIKFKDYAESAGIELHPEKDIEDVQFVLPERELISTLQQNLLTSMHQWKLQTLR